MASPLLCPRHLQVGREAQRLRQRAHAGAPDIVVGDDVDGRRRIRQTLGVTRHRRHLDIGELLERKIGKAGDLHLRRVGGRQEERGERANVTQCATPRIYVPTTIIC